MLMRGWLLLFEERVEVVVHYEPIYNIKKQFDRWGGTSRMSISVLLDISISMVRSEKSMGIVNKQICENVRKCLFKEKSQV